MERFGELIELEAPEVVDAATRAARARSPHVAALPIEEIRRHVNAMIEAARAALTKGEVDELDLRAAERLGADRARQGVPVAALLDGFQAGRSLVVRMIIERGRRQGLPADELLEGVTRIDAVATALEHRMVHAHRGAELELARTARDADTQRLRQALRGEPGAELDPEKRYHCLVSDVSDPAAAGELERLLDGGLSGLVDGRLTALVPRLPPLPPDPGAPLVIAAPAAPPADIPGLYELCREALAAATGRSGLWRLADLAFGVATASRPELGRLLAEDLLDGLDPADAFHLLLAETALVYLDNSGRVEPTATALHVHPNTVKYRVRRFGEITGRHLSGRPGMAVADTAHLWWALRSLLRDAPSAPSASPRNDHMR
ncbi:MAG TPA: helix-turn-helix domain-containing protein [Streptosporangiaceae bacterium]|nr:helix-turn-helix domain-containing protein [Streptosporangiaceae bacterium]